MTADVSMNPQLGQTPATPAVGKRNTLFLYSTTVSDTGYVRSNNQDSSFAGERLIAICDGMGGHAGGDTASTIAVRSLAHIEVEPDTPQTVGEVAALLETSVIAAHDAIVGKAKRERKLAGMGTTVTAVALVEDHWVLAHIGDSRAYLLRNGRIIRATKDHSYVQHLIDIGKITPGEAACWAISTSIRAPISPYARPSPATVGCCVPTACAACCRTPRSARPSRRSPTHRNAPSSSSAWR